MWEVKKYNYEYIEMRKILYVHDDADNNWIFLWRQPILDPIFFTSYVKSL